LFFSVAVNYIDRNIIGILKMPLSRELGWGETDYAHIAAAFQFAYACGYLFGGRMMDWMGVKRGLPSVVLLWSIAAAAHGLCSFIPASDILSVSLPWASSAAKTLTWSIPTTVFGFMAARVTLGLAQGGNFPGAIKAVAEWFPVKERALATGLFNAGTNVGAIICPIAVPWMYSAWGCRRPSTSPAPWGCSGLSRGGCFTTRRTNTNYSPRPSGITSEAAGRRPRRRRRRCPGFRCSATARCGLI
jgi:ACS family hexuronate transporter-like MFS transporter